MKLFKVREHKLLVVLLLGCIGLSYAQKKEPVLKERFNVKDDVTIKVDTRYTNVVFETWDKNEVSVEAFVETTDDVTKDEIKKIADNWKINANGNSGEITITSAGNLNWNGDMNLDLAALQSLQNLPLDFIGPMVEGIIVPMTESIATEMPKDFYKNMRDIDFDYKAYKKNPDAYMKSYEKQMKEHFGDDYEGDLEAWGEDFGKKMEAWGKQFEENLGDDMEKWGENFEKEYGPKLQAWAQQMAEQYGGEYATTKSTNPNGSSTTTIVKYNTVKPGNFTNDNVKRTIIIKMPKESRLRLDVRHGEIKLAERIKNIQAKLSHTRLAANIIDGGQTSISAAYSPVLVKQWNYGELNTNYVKECVIDNAKNIKLVSKSSDVVIKNLEEIGVISGTFSRIAIPEINQSITNLDVVLENSDFIVSLPSSAFNFTFNGNRSGLKYPPSLQVQTVKNANNDRVTGFHRSRNTSANLAISARFSNVILK
ncbi:hypothetical protein [Croceibacter atlanticus]|uniref:hypothetical protein n=1 Tax=Croceibacter atlanticus TaxID=313588 RepID=UPI0030F860D6